MGAVAKVLLSPALAIGTALAKPKQKAQPAPMQQPMAQPPRATALMDAVAGRRGSRANQRTQRLGGEPTGGGSKTSLGA